MSSPAESAAPPPSPQPIPVEALRERAIALHMRNDLAAAEPLYEQLLQGSPRDLQTLLMFGVLAAQTQRLPRAASLLRRAIEVDPLAALAHNNLGIVLTELQNLEAAARSFDRALELAPQYADGYCNRGVVLARMRRFADALQDYDTAIRLQPTSAPAHNNRGSALLQMRRPVEALQSFDQALALQPDHAQAHANRGDALRHLGRPEDALASAERALALQPHMPEALIVRGAALQDLRRPDEALASYEQAIRLQPNWAVALSHQGAALCALGRAYDALASCDRAIALDPSASEAHSNRGLALQDLLLPEEALTSFEKAIELDADSAAAHHNRAGALEQLGRHEEALASFDRCIALDPENADAHFNKAVCLLRAGRLAEGWPLYEWRKKRKPSAASLRLPQPLWLGETSLHGKLLYLHSEQGIGDILQFCRFAQLAESRGARVALAAPPRLHRLLGTLSPTIRIVADTEVVTAADYHCPLASLPAAFGTTLDTLPAEVPYLQAQSERVTLWRERLGRRGFKVGICWQGQSGRVDFGRSPPLALFERISRIPGVRLISLQKGPGCAQLHQLPPGMGIETLGESFDADSDGFLDTAAVMECLDLIISSDTSVAHLAGALGRPAWIALKDVPDWRWMLERADSPWYPTLRLFRQTRPGDWEGVFALMHEELRAALDVRSHAAAPAPAEASPSGSHSAQWWLQRGNALLALRRYEQALESYDQALVLQPDDSILLNARGVALEGVGRWDQAAACYRRAIALQPDYAKAHSNLGRALREFGDLTGAIESFRTAVVLQPDFAMAHNNLGCALYDLGDLTGSVASFRRTLELEPTLRECEYNLAITLLKTGNFAAGWLAFESRLGARLRSKSEPPLGLERWDGQELGERTLVLVAEQGYGDVIQFCRYASLLNARGIRTALQVDPKLAALLSSTGYFSAIVPPGTAFAPAQHVWYPLLSLPLLFHTDIEHIPACDSYLRADQGRSERWAERLADLDGLKIGIAWQGNPRSEVASLRGRSMALAELAPLASLPGVTLISLQKGTGREQLAKHALSACVLDWTEELDAGPDAFLDTAALMASLDLIITVDTATAHLAGALGRPVWVALHHASDWRWFQTRSDSPWYPSMRLFRQAAPGAWGAVVQSIREQLEREALSRR